MAIALETASVLIVDDGDGSRVWDQRFSEHYSDLLERRAPARLFARVGEVCKTATYAEVAVLRMLEHGMKVDLVIIDDELRTRPGAAEFEKSAVRLVKFIVGAYRSDAEKTDDGEPPLEEPKCVLRSAGCSPGLAFAFCHHGGSHAFNASLPTSDFLDKLWDVLKGETWSHVGKVPKLALTPSQLKVMPYFHAGLPTHEIVRRMLAAGELTPRAGEIPTVWGADWIHQRSREIMQRASDHAESLGNGRPFEGGGVRQAMAEYAIEYGNVWMPLEYRDGT